MLFTVKVFWGEKKQLNILCSAESQSYWPSEGTELFYLSPHLREVAGAQVLKELVLETTKSVENLPGLVYPAESQRY